MSTGLPHRSKLTIRPTSIFILRTCLGWLFDQPNIPNEYYKYRQNRKPLGQFIDVDRSDYSTVQILVPKTIESYFNSEQKVTLQTDYRNGNDDGNVLHCTLQKSNLAGGVAGQRAIELGGDTASVQNELSLNELDPLLENILNAACPFLADFRVSIMPRKNSKTVSRTGRYRHVTTKIYESTPNKNPVIRAKDDIQTRLTDAFLQSQSLSVRRTVEFVLERTVSAVIKDFQVEFFIPIKKVTLAKVDLIQTDGRQAIEDKLYDIYNKGEKQLADKWNDVIPNMIGGRVKVGNDLINLPESQQIPKYIINYG